MTNSYVITKVPSPEAVTALLTGAKTFTTDTDGQLFSLTATDRKTMNKSADKTVAFVDKGKFYIENNPEFSPANMKLDLMKVDADTIDLLVPLQKVLTEVLSKVTDTITLAKSEQLRGVRKYYNSTAQAAKENDPGAKPIYDDMNPRYKKSTSKKDKPAEGGKDENITVVA